MNADEKFKCEMNARAVMICRILDIVAEETGRKERYRGKGKRGGGERGKLIRIDSFYLYNPSVFLKSALH